MTTFGFRGEALASIAMVRELPGVFVFQRLYEVQVESVGGLYPAGIVYNSKSIYFREEMLRTFVFQCPLKSAKYPVLILVRSSIVQ